MLSQVLQSSCRELVIATFPFKILSPLNEYVQKSFWVLKATVLNWN